MGKVHFIAPDGSEHRVEVAAGETLMQAAVWNRVPGIVAHCGGAVGCATCQIVVEPPWIDRLGEPTSTERRTLRFAFDPQPNSRLSCALKMTANLDGLVVRIPPRQF